jgi:hypothetical protein
MDKLGNHSRSIAIAANSTVQVFTVPIDRDAPYTWMIQATNVVDGNAPVITLTVDHTSPSGVLLPILTQIGPRESVQLYATGTINITAFANAATTLEISVTAIGGGQIPIPPLTFTSSPGAVAFLACSANNGYAPPGRRYFTVYGSQDFDMEFRTAGGGVVFTSPANNSAAPSGPAILPPGLRLLAKGNAVAAVISTVWTQKLGS